MMNVETISQVLEGAMNLKFVWKRGIMHSAWMEKETDTIPKLEH